MLANLYFVFLYKLKIIMTKLSVNINKIATLRNSRGGNVPDLLKVAKDIQQFALMESLFIQDQMKDTFVIKTLAI